MNKVNGNYWTGYTDCKKNELYTELKRFGCNDKTAQTTVSNADEQDMTVIGFTEMTWNCKKSFLVIKQEDGLFSLITYKGKTHEEAANAICTIFECMTNN